MLLNKGTLFNVFFWKIYLTFAIDGSIYNKLLFKKLCGA